MSRDEVERQQRISEARQFYIALPAMLPIVQRKRKAAYEKLLASYRGGELENANLIAELSVLDALEREITIQEQYYKEAGEKK